MFLKKNQRRHTDNIYFKFIDDCIQRAKTLNKNESESNQSYTHAGLWPYGSDVCLSTQGSWVWDLLVS
jgi:hypothetical protein